MDIIAPNTLKVNSETETISARSIHDGLEISNRFSDWFNQFKSDFVEGTDFTSVTAVTEVKNNGGIQTRDLQDYQISIEMAKHICMMSHSEKGKKMRQYFIDLEKAWNTPDLVIARGLLAANTLIAQKDEKIKNLTAENEVMKPKAIFADAVSTSKSSILIGDLAKLISQNGYEIGPHRLFDWMREKGYLIKTGSSTNMPCQRYIEQGLFRVKETSIQNPDGSVRLTRTTKVTGKGQLYFVNKFAGGVG